LISHFSSHGSSSSYNTIHINSPTILELWSGNTGDGVEVGIKKNRRTEENKTTLL
jgi:hypothetical protein